MNDKLFGRAPHYDTYADKRNYKIQSDERARTVSNGPPPSVFPVPTKHDFRDQFQHVRQQAGMDCSSQAVLACFEQSWFRLVGTPFNGAPEYAYLVARLYEYRNRLGEWSMNFSWVSPANALRALRHIGCCENDWFSSPYISLTEGKPESHGVLASALDHRIETYSLVAPQWRKYLLAHDVSMIITVRWAKDNTAEDMWSESMHTPAPRIRFKDPADIEEWSPFDHAMTLCGYDDEQQCFWARSSSGHLYADNGYVQVPYSWYDDYMFGWWAVTQVRGRNGVK